MLRGLLVTYLYVLIHVAALAQPDTTPPQLIRVEAPSATALRMVFNEPLSGAAVQNVTQYLLNPGAVAATSVSWLASTPAVVALTLPMPLVPNQPYTLLYVNLRDAAGNLASGTSNFSYVPIAPAVANDIVLSELMVQPRAPAGGPSALPDAEYIELYNRSSKAIDITGWQLRDATGNLATLPACILRPAEFVLLVAASRINLFSGMGSVIGIGISPTFLNNDGDTLTLRTGAGATIHTARYSTRTYADPTKATGGWALELADANNVCPDGPGYRASENPNGGTPALPNSIWGRYRDLAPPYPIGALAVTASQLRVVFSESVDVSRAAQTDRYAIAGFTVLLATPLMNQRAVDLLLNTALASNQRYTLTVTGISDCAGNTSGTVELTVALTTEALPGELLINEILFNPRVSERRYLELVNATSKNLSLRGIQLAKGEASPLGTNVITDSLTWLAPGDVVCVTPDTAQVKATYQSQVHARFIQAEVPTYDAQTDGVWLLTPFGSLSDKLVYEAAWHHPDVQNREGVALERVNAQAPTQSASNWQSAASTRRYGTPGYANSQRTEAGGDDAITLERETVIPGGAAPLDKLGIRYHFEQGGVRLKAEVYSLQGHRVRTLATDLLAGTEPGMLYWDGATEGGSPVPICIYAIVVTAQPQRGAARTYRKACIVGSRL